MTTTARAHLPEPVRELRRALAALDAVIAVRYEERQGGPRERRLSIEGADQAIPPVTQYVGVGPLAELVATAHLNDAEALILTSTLAEHIDEKYCALFAGLTDRPEATGLTGEVARTLVARSFDARLRAAALLEPGSRLVRMGLVTLDPPEDLTGRVRADPELVRWVLGLPPGAPTDRDFPARQLATVHTLDDVILPSQARTRVDELALRIAHRDTVVQEWGFGDHHDNSSGLIALFHGPPGTGKTMTAAALARSTGRPAFVVDLSGLVSKYIGETEKNLARIFDHAARLHCVLVFDEADAVFGKRTGVSDSHDRYANQSISYLLSRVEQHPGVVILTTNLLANIDEAFLRRIHVKIEFPSPGINERVRLWNGALPAQLPTDNELDFSALAEQFAITGAQIRDASMDAAYLAAAGPGRVSAHHLVAGIRRQYEKAGRTAPK